MRRSEEKTIVVDIFQDKIKFAKEYFSLSSFFHFFEFDAIVQIYRMTHYFTRIYNLQSEYLR